MRKKAIQYRLQCVCRGYFLCPLVSYVVAILPPKKILSLCTLVKDKRGVLLQIFDCMAYSMGEGWGGNISSRDTGTHVVNLCFDKTANKIQKKKFLFLVKMLSSLQQKNSIQTEGP